MAFKNREIKNTIVVKIELTFGYNIMTDCESRIEMALDRAGHYCFGAVHVALLCAIVALIVLLSEKSLAIFKAE